MKKVTSLLGRLRNSSGIYLWDASGKKFIDGPGGMWCVQIGYGRQEMADAIAKQANEHNIQNEFLIELLSSVDK